MSHQARRECVMEGVKIGEDFVSAKVAKDGVIDFIRQTVGPRENPRTGRPMKPDLIFAIDVIKRTIPVNVLKGEKRAEFERAINTLFDMRDKMSQMETTLGIFWQVEDG
jgi:hypothetical protein